MPIKQVNHSSALGVKTVEFRAAETPTAIDERLKVVVNIMVHFDIGCIDEGAKVSLAGAQLYDIGTYLF